MNLFNKQHLGYVKEKDFLGAVAGLDFRKGEVTLTSDDETITVKRGDVEFLQEVGELNGVTVFHKDVLSGANGSLVEVELHSDGLVQLHALDSKFNRKVGKDASGGKFLFDDEAKEQLEPILELEGNLYELKGSLPKVDFNIKIVKDFDGKSFTYFYACNNKATGEVDLIKVVFVGQNLLKEEEYERRTLSHEVYLDSINSDTLKEVSQQELMNYATGVMYGKKEEVVFVEEEDEGCCEECNCVETEDFEEEAETCEDCDKLVEDCDCELW